MDFWKMGYDLQWFGLHLLSQAVITKDNPFGDITPEQYEEICGKKFTGIVEE